LGEGLLTIKDELLANCHTDLEIERIIFNDLGTQNTRLGTWNVGILYRVG